MSISIKIEGIEGKLKGKKWKFINPSMIKIGRYGDNDIVIPVDETSISRLQCQIQVIDGKEVIILDKDGKSASPGGTWINNRKVISGEKGCVLVEEQLLGLGKAGNVELFKLSVIRSNQEIPEEAPKEENHSTVIVRQEKKEKTLSLEEAYKMLDNILKKNTGCDAK